MYNECSKRTVKVHEVPYEIPEEKVKKIFMEYGIIKTIKRKLGK